MCSMCRHTLTIVRLPCPLPLRTLLPHLTTLNVTFDDIEFTCADWFEADNDVLPETYASVGAYLPQLTSLKLRWVETSQGDLFSFFNMSKIIKPGCTSNTLTHFDTEWFGTDTLGLLLQYTPKLRSLCVSGLFGLKDTHSKREWAVEELRCCSADLFPEHLMCLPRTAGGKMAITTPDNPDKPFILRAASTEVSNM